MGLGWKVTRNTASDMKESGHTKANRLHTNAKAVARQRKAECFLNKTQTHNVKLAEV